MTRSIPVFRIFDYTKTLEFYINWLGFRINWEDRREGCPLYMEIELGDIVLHLSEHHGDCTPGSRIYIKDFENLKDYQHELIAKQYKYNKPGLHKTPWNTIEMEVIDPFGNRLTFNENI